MQRLFRYKHESTNNGMTYTIDKWYISKVNKVGDTGVSITVKELENDEDYEELV